MSNLLKEKRFPFEGITKEERDFCLNIIRNCKDISDSNHPVAGTSKCEIIELSFKKNNNQIDINGTLSIGNDKKRENRCISGYISIQSSSILVDMHITRLCVETSCKEYGVIDEFKIENGNLVRNSFYDYDIEEFTEKIDNEEMKGRLK